MSIANYDTNSFLAGLALGRQTIVWGGNSTDNQGDFRKYCGWYADPFFTRINRGKLAYYDLYGDGKTLEDSGIVYSTDSYASLSGNVITMNSGSTSHNFYISSSNFAIGDTITMHVIVHDRNYSVMVYTFYNASNILTADGVFVVTSHNQAAARASSIGSSTLIYNIVGNFGSICFYPTLNDGATDFRAYATIEIDYIHVDYSCYKQNQGYCICVFVKYKDEESNIRITPCLISSIRHFTIYGSTDNGTSQTGHITTHTLNHMTFYMCSDYNPPLANNRDLVGAPILDFTTSDPITSKDQLFSMVASATHLTPYLGLPS